MSDAVSGSDGQSLEIEVPADPLASHPASAYLWGHIAGSGDVGDDTVEVVTNDEASANVLAAIAGGEIDHETNSREYAHDASITRTEDEYTLEIGSSETASGDTVRETDDALFGRRSTLGLPVDGRGNYRFSAFSSHERELLRGILEGCGTICFKSKSETVGISFVHDDEALLELTRELIEDCPIEAPMGELSETSSGGYWFGVDDAAAPEFGTWLYEDCEETGLYAPSRERKLRKSLEQAESYD
ncbi:cobalamin biosynthesis protein [Halostagnicola sp. A-GB9-2]|uniref:cobalamin biosynthesis protein n=1 Tax=Halostagnicola sp. A-GB9-2 TaxID=3048066 RepID=UPI0024C0AA6E|nr:cobalamin biosynthesis protein [Halostagnicola sp. A-GB9-2]MDJ1430569.1 cobalamin biosynthesis protein [Halostagnicola sp. A-GB9-2]